MAFPAGPPSTPVNVSRQRRARIGTTAVALGSAAIGLVVAILPMVLSDAGRMTLYESESSIVELGSIVLWIMLALAIPFLSRPLRVAGIAGIGVCLAFAAREAELHRVFDDQSMLKFGFHLDAEHSPVARILSACAVGLAGACIVVAGVAVLRRARRDGGFRASWVRLAAATALLAIFSKVLDRAPAIIEEQGVAIHPLLRTIATSFEEHLELLLPVLVFVTILISIRRGPSPPLPC